MARITEKVVATRTPDNVQLNINEMPKHEVDTLCRVVLRSASEAFKNPQFRADYEVWLKERKAREAV